MTTDEVSCPRCASADVSGTEHTDGIVLRCGACGHTWERGRRGCATCGGSELVTIPQLITTTPRGNQVSIIGRRQVLVCRACDAAGVSDYLERGVPLPSTYQSAARRVEVEPTSAPPRASTPRRRAAPAPRQVPSPPPAPAPAALTNPTVRQAMEHFQQSAPDPFALALVMLGREAGPTSRLGDPGTADLLTGADAWAERTFTGGNREPAIATVRAFVEHCRDRGWL